MAIERARKVTPTGDCIEVAGWGILEPSGSVDALNSDGVHSGPEDGDKNKMSMRSDDGHILDPDDALDLLGNAFTARLGCPRSPHGPLHKSSRPRSSTKSTSSRRTGSKATMPSANDTKPSQPVKRPRSPNIPSPTSNNRRKRQKSTTTESSQTQSIRYILPVTDIKTQSRSQSGMSFGFMGKTKKPAPHKSHLGSSKVSNRSGPPPIDSDLFPSGSSHRRMGMPNIDLTEDAPDEPTEPYSPRRSELISLQKRHGELVLERDDYRRSLREANARINAYVEADLLEKARAEIELEKQEAEAAMASRDLRDAKERSSQLDKINKDLHKQLEVNEAKNTHLQQSLYKQVEQWKHLDKIREGLEERFKAKGDAVVRLQQGLEREQEERKADVQRLQNLLDQQATKYEFDVLRLHALEKQVVEDESAIARFEAEASKAKEDFDEQKWEADWFKEKFLKFKRSFLAQVKADKKKDALIQHILVVANAAGWIFDDALPTNEFDTAMEKLRTQTAHQSDVRKDPPVADEPIANNSVLAGVSEG